METKTTYTFTFKIEGREYSFNTIAESREEALKLLREDLAKIIAEINFDAKK